MNADYTCEKCGDQGTCVIVPGFTYTCNNLACGWHVGYCVGCGIDLNSYGDRYKTIRPLYATECNDCWWEKCRVLNEELRNGAA